MKKEKAYIGVIVVLSAILTISILFDAAPYVHMDPKVNANVYVTDNVGGVTSELYSGNLITDIGEYFIGNATLGLENNGTWAISLSNVGSPLATWTQLDTEVNANGFSRTAASEVRWQNSGDFAVNFTVTFTCSGTQQLQTAGLQWGSTPMANNNLFAAATFTQTTFNPSDTLTITWVVTYNAN